MAHASTTAARRARRFGIKERKARVAAIRRDLTKLRGTRDRVLVALKQSCAKARTKTRERVAAVREEHALALKHRIQEMRAAARARCAGRCAKAKLAYSTEKARRRAEIRAQAREAAELLDANRASLTPAEKRARARALERAHEADEFVRNDLPPELHVVYRRVKRLIPKATKHADGRTRTSKAERFIEWVEENPDQVLAITQAHAEKQLRKLVKAHEAEERALHEHHLKNLRKAGYSAGDAAKLLELGLEPSGARVKALGSVPF